MIQEISLVLQEPLWSGKPKTVYFKAMLWAIEANLANCTSRVSGKLGILAKHLEWLNCASHTTKILQNFWPTLVILFLMKFCLYSDKQPFISGIIFFLCFSWIWITQLLRKLTYGVLVVCYMSSLLKNVCTLICCIWRERKYGKR